MRRSTNKQSLVSWEILDQIHRGIIGTAFVISYDQTRSARYAALLERTQWRPWEEIRALHEDKLRCLLHHGFENVSLYRDLFRKAGIRPEDIRATTDLVQLPILSKTDLQDHPEQLLSQKINRKKLVTNQSGGRRAVRPGSREWPPPSAIHPVLRISGADRTLICGDVQALPFSDKAIATTLWRRQKLEDN